ncbi:N-acetylneuraminate synthase family protein [Nitrospinae bacterium AH_259_B05_G02_I21]|nr:N-acetylneuraminate synthase family protein [Nitrospinae bacterium AH_259_B05_G02_I21]MDA2931660.1 N-acetylneuraminate synthase family protein [Nitrospinae bacterium AH-259-F20]
MKQVKLGDKWVGDKTPVYFVAEIGGNFKTVEKGVWLIDAAVRVGLDAVKLQTFEAETITTKKAMFNLEVTGYVPQYEVFKKSEPPKELQRAVFEHARSKGVTIYSAPSHMKDLEFMEELGVPIYKIGSDLACHIPLLREVAQTGKPIILSTGMCTLEEVQESVETIDTAGAGDRLIMLHCVSNYPTKHHEANLRVIPTMKEAFGLPVGWSDHTLGTEVSLAAVALGANMVERHFTYDKTADGPDHILSLTEEEYRQLIETVRAVEPALGHGRKVPSSSEEEHRLTNRVGIVTLVDIPAGTIITEEMVDVRRPGNGIAPKHWDEVLGWRASRNLEAEEPLHWEDLA